MTNREDFRFFRWLILILATGSVAAGAAPLTWHLGGHHEIEPPPVALPVQATQDAEPIDLAETLALAPFGSTQVAPAAEETAEAIPLDLVLLGVIVRDDPARSLALISASGEEANYRTGDTVAEDVTLLSVAQSHVMLDVKGESRRLAFAGEEFDEDTPKVLTGAERLAALMVTTDGPSISEQVDAAQKSRPTSTRGFIDMWRERIRANPAEVLDTIGLVPTDKGYRIADEHDTGVSRAGLQAGDVVTTVNGQAVGNVEQDRALYDSVAASGIARIEVERNGKTIVMSFPLQ